MSGLSLKRRLILASASPRRHDLLMQIGLKPEVLPSQVEEVITESEPQLVVMELARQKAMDIAAKYVDEAVVIMGADTVVAIDGKILGKPQDVIDAVRMLTLLQGRTHQVYTGVTLIGSKPEQITTFAECTDVTVFPMSEAEILAYVETGEPMDKAGGYGIQGCFAAYISRINGDYSNVVGLPVGSVWQELKKLEGFSW